MGEYVYGSGSTTLVHVLLTFDTLEDLEKILAMGFREGFKAGLENLDRYLAAHFYLRRQNKTNKKARVTTYLNFPGRTEEAFTFSKRFLSRNLSTALSVSKIFRQIQVGRLYRNH